MKHWFGKAALLLAVALAFSYPVFTALQVISAGNLLAQCAGSGRARSGLFCEWGPRLGHLMFGAEHSHFGYVVLMAIALLVLLGFSALAAWGQRSASPD